MAPTRIRLDSYPRLRQLARLALIDDAVSAFDLWRCANVEAANVVDRVVLFAAALEVAGRRLVTRGDLDSVT